jgi:ankyrin repeat protein
MRAKAILSSVIIMTTMTACTGAKMNAKKLFDNPKTAALAEAASKGDKAAVDRAVVQGADVNGTGQGGITPLLFVLSSTRNKDGMRALLSAGANPNYISPDGVCPLLATAQGKYPELLRIILDGGGNPNLENRDGESAVFLAARQYRFENVEVLLKAGANINAKDRSGYSVLMLMGMLRQYKEAAQLMSQGADLNAVARNGHTFAEIVADAKVPTSSPEYEWREKVIAMLAAKSINVNR